MVNLLETEPGARAVFTGPHMDPATRYAVTSNVGFVKVSATAYVDGAFLYRERPDEQVREFG